MNLPFVSIIIPNLHSPMIDQVINALLKQKYKGKFEIIVVGKDKFNLLKQFKKHSQIKIITTKKPAIPSRARNIGIKKAKGEYLFFLDADCLVQPDWIFQLLKNYDTDNNRVVGGSFCLEKSDNFWRFCDNLSHFYAVSSRLKKGQVKGLTSANLSIPRAILKKVGKFNESLVAGEDREYCMRILRAGYLLIFEPSAEVIHLSQRTSLLSVLRHSYFWGPYSLKVRLKYSDIERVPFFMKNRLTLILMAPIIALGSTIRVFTRSPSHLLYLYTLPIVYLSKIFWCLGAFVGLKKIK